LTLTSIICILSRQLGADLAPIQTKIKTKEAEKQRVISSEGQDQEQLDSTLRRFEDDVNRFHDLTEQIDRWSLSGGQGELDSVNSQFSKIGNQIVERKKALEKAEAELEMVKNLLKDQERSKNQLQLSLDLIAEKEVIGTLEKEVRLKEEAIARIPGGSDALDLQEHAEARKTKLFESKAQIDGRRSEVVERIRSLRRKLSAPEYKDVDKQYKVSRLSADLTSF